MINELSIAMAYKINIQKPVTFWYSNDKLSEKEIKKTIPLTVASKNSKILRGKFNQGSERSVHWKYKTLIKEIKEDI